MGLLHKYTGDEKGSSVWFVSLSVYLEETVATSDQSLGL